MTDTIQNHHNYLLSLYPYRGLEIERGEGNYLYNKEGTKYLDLVTGFGVNIFGHSHPHITSKLVNQVTNLTTLHNSFANEQRSTAAERLSGTLDHKYKMYFGGSGTEAAESAMKFAKVITGRTKFVAFKKGYHGKSLATLGVNGNEKYTNPFKEIISHHTLLDSSSLGDLNKSITKETAAVFIEPVQGEGGINPIAPQVIQALRERTQAVGSLLIVDEVQAGLGRTGEMYAFQNSDIQPDIICLGKGLGGGIALSATLVHKKFAAKIPKGTHTSTLGGNPLASTGLNAVLDLLTSEVIENNKELGQYFIQQLEDLIGSFPQVTEIRGRGLMIGIEINQDPTPILKKLQDNNILAAPASNNVIRFLPPYTITKEEINQTISVLLKIFNSEY